MKWIIELNGEGGYWWKSETPLGPVYAEFDDSKHPNGWYAYWHPYDVDQETAIEHCGSDDAAKDAAEKWIKQRARRDAKRLLRFAE